MASLSTITFSKSIDTDIPVLVVFVDDGNASGGAGGELLARLAGGFTRLAEAAGFKGKSGACLDLVAPAGLDVARLLVIGVGGASSLDLKALLKLGGTVAGKLRDIKVAKAGVVLDLPGFEMTPEAAAEFVLGARLRAYGFDKYKTRRKDDAGPTSLELDVVVESAGKARKAWKEAEAAADSIELARDLINEAPNVLGPQEFAGIAAKLDKIGLEVEILDEKDMKKKGMGALLAVGKGSERPPRLVVLRWNGADGDKAPVAFVGKGVCFDSGGISIKPAAGMEDMKGDMAGAAAVVGVMRLLAARKACVNAVGILGLVENMPDGGAYRPGDILTSMSGQTIEVVNTDAEGRLVLADALWYCQDRFKPVFMVNLATLTGAIMVALGHQIAGLFSNDDELAARLVKAGEDTEERLWRMPMGPEYDKLIDSKFADMKNSGGRLAGSITAAQFLKRFVNDVPWAHLDIAGTAMGSPDSEINRSWSAGYGVRLLDRLVRDNYEG